MTLLAVVQFLMTMALVTKTENGETPLYLARQHRVSKRSLERLQLLEATKSGYGMTLHFTYSLRTDDPGWCVQLLVAIVHLAEVTVQTKGDNNTLHVAISKKKNPVDIIAFLNVSSNLTTCH